MSSPEMGIGRASQLAAAEPRGSVRIAKLFFPRGQSQLAGTGVLREGVVEDGRRSKLRTLKCKGHGGRVGRVRMSRW
jgi:hypothetical protein